LLEFLNRKDATIAKISMDSFCEHTRIKVDYHHPQGTVTLLMADLVASDAHTTRPVMILANPRCDRCGQGLTRMDLEHRLMPGGDLFERFQFEWWFICKKTWRPLRLCGEK
jgi:hypothetical protein